jgi:PPOX class probable F420-dependent enzyme
VTTQSKSIIPPAFEDLLSKKGFAHLATLGPEGEPRSQPMWYDWDGQNILLTHTKARVKYRNLQRDPRVALSIADPDDPYRYLEIRGVVESIQDDPERKLIDSLSRKYLGKDPFPSHRPGDERVIIRIRPTRVNTYGD